MNTLVNDLRFALRQWAKSPGFTIAVVAVLGLGIGAATTMFTVVEGVLLRPLPLDHPEQLVTLAGATFDELEHWATAPSLQKVALWRSGGVNFTGRAETFRINAAAVHGDFFGVFRVQPLQGRVFFPNGKDDQGRPVVISHALWKNFLAGEENILGRAIFLDQLPHTVIGVMPPGFSFPGGTNVWIPFRSSNLALGEEGTQKDLPFSLRMGMIARLREGQSVEHVKRDMKVLMQRLAEKYAGTNHAAPERIGVRPLLQSYIAAHENGVLVLFAAVGFLLLMTTVNVSGLLVARASGRQKEMAVRLCLGAGPSRILRQLLTESSLLAFTGGIVGIVLARWLVAVVRSSGPGDMPRLATLEMNPGVLAFTALITVFAACFVGLVPAAHSFAPDLAGALKEETSSSASRFGKNLRRILIVSEIGLTLALLIAAVLSLQSLYRLLGEPSGLNPARVYTLSVGFPQPPVGISVTEAERGRVSAQRADMRRRVLQGVSALPGVTAVGAIRELPLRNPGYFLSLKIADTVFDMAGFDYIEGDYFKAMGIPLLAGRNFTAADSFSAPKVMIVSQLLARRVWGSRNPIGEQLLIEGEDYSEGGNRTVVGVVGDVRRQHLGKEAVQQFYLPYDQPYRGGLGNAHMVLVVRTAIDSEEQVRAVRLQIQKAAPGLAVFGERTMAGVIADATAAWRFRSVLLASFAVIALILAVAGVYGMIGFVVANRTGEIGVRMALGAHPEAILRMILLEGAQLAAAGILLGLLATLALQRTLATILYSVSPLDGLTLILSVAAMLATVIAACLVPAIRASRISPIQALRHE